MKKKSKTTIKKLCQNQNMKNATDRTKTCPGLVRSYEPDTMRLSNQTDAENPFLGSV